jgi:hypothetical protein
MDPVRLKSGTRISIVVFTSISIALSNLFPSQGASVLDLLPGGSQSPGYYGVTFEERQSGYSENVSVITSNVAVADRVNGVAGMFLCSSMDDPQCSKGAHVTAQLILPPCVSATDRMCVEALSIGSTSATMEPAILEKEIASLKSPADSITGLPRGGGPSLWSAPTVANKSGTKTYGVNVRVMYFQNREKAGSAGKRNAPITLTSMRVSVFPVSITAGKYYPLESYSTVNSDGGATYGIRPTGNDYDNLTDCAWTESGSCAKYVDFADNTRVGLSLRMGSEMTGWLYGRMKDVDVEVSPLGDKFNKIYIEANPVAAPGAYGFIKKSELKNNPKLDERIRLSSGEFGYNEMINSDFSRVSGYDPVGNFEDFQAFEPILKTKPGYRAQWVVSAGASANGYRATSSNACFEDKTKLLGIVTTNALIYSPAAPEFKDGTLNYKVAGLHHTEDGVTLTRGSYDLAIRSSVARCVYGFTDAPFQASISVVGADGTEQTIATESVREDKKREWLFLSAQNFTFSAPTIKVKLVQDKPLSAAPSQSDKPISATTAPSKQSAPVKKAAPKLKVINCIKGKMSKKVSGTNPKCPSGYKTK